jgi:hypothetical protein
VQAPCAPEASAEGSPPGDPVPNEVRGNAVPNEVRDARLALRRTKKEARQDKVGGTFLNSLSRTISFKKVATLFCREKPHVSSLGGSSFRAASQRTEENSCLRLGVTCRLLIDNEASTKNKKPPGRGRRGMRMDELLSWEEGVANPYKDNQ